MRITRLVADTDGNPQDLLDWLSTVAVALGLPNPVTTPASLPTPDGTPAPTDPNKIERTVIIPLSAFPPLLRPVGVDAARAKVGLALTIRRALYSNPAGVDGEGRPTFVVNDRGWEADIATYSAGGYRWDVGLLADIITMSIEATEVSTPWQTVSRGAQLLPVTPDGWAVVVSEHPTVGYPEWESPTAISSGEVMPPPVVPGDV